LSELVECKKVHGNTLGDDFVKGIKKGREDLEAHYMNMFYLFGDIFCIGGDLTRNDFIVSICNGKNVSDVISQNMEALMITILEMGCGKDWPEYLSSDEYQTWLMGRSSRENTHGNFKKPVSLVCQ